MVSKSNFLVLFLLCKTRTFSPCTQSEIKIAIFPLGRGVGALLALTLMLRKLLKTSVNQISLRNASILVVVKVFFSFSKLPTFLPRPQLALGLMVGFGVVQQVAW